MEDDSLWTWPRILPGRKGSSAARRIGPSEMPAKRASPKTKSPDVFGQQRDMEEQRGRDLLDADPVDSVAEKGRERPGLKMVLYGKGLGELGELQVAPYPKGIDAIGGAADEGIVFFQQGV
jgi:hypothetical protein